MLLQPTACPIILWCGRPDVQQKDRYSVLMCHGTLQTALILTLPGCQLILLLQGLVLGAWDTVKEP